MALLVSAWEIAKEQITRETQVRAEARALHLPRPTTHNERTAMRRAVEAGAGGKLPDDESPGAALLAAKMEQVEQNEHVAHLWVEPPPGEEHDAKQQENVHEKGEAEQQYSPW